MEPCEYCGGTDEGDKFEKELVHEGYCPIGKLVTMREGLDNCKHALADARCCLEPGPAKDAASWAIKAAEDLLAATPKQGSG